MEAAPTDSALERRDHSLWVVVRPVDVQRLAVPAERDRAPAIPGPAPRPEGALARAVLRPLRFHDLRHTFGTRMIAKADIRRVQEWMGHADIQTTMKILVPVWYPVWIELPWPKEKPWISGAFQ